MDKPTETSSREPGFQDRCHQFVGAALEGKPMAKAMGVQLSKEDPAVFAGLVTKELGDVGHRHAEAEEEQKGVTQAKIAASKVGALGIAARVAALLAAFGAGATTVHLTQGPKSTRPPTAQRGINEGLLPPPHTTVDSAQSSPPPVGGESPREEDRRVRDFVLRYLDEEINERPHDPHGYLERAEQFSHYDQHQAALDDLQHALTLHRENTEHPERGPALDELHYNIAISRLGPALRAVDKLQEALTAHDEAIALRGDHTHRERGLTYLRIGETATEEQQRRDALQKAIADFTTAIDTYVREHEPWRMREENKSGRDDDIVVESITLIHGDGPLWTPHQEHIGRGQAQERLGKFDKAHEDYSQAVSYSPRSSKALGALAAFLERSDTPFYSPQKAAEYQSKAAQPTASD